MYRFLVRQNSKCDGEAKMSSLLCNQYYQCVKSWYIPWSLWTWKIEICPDGESYDAETEECRLGSCGTTSSSIVPIHDEETISTKLFTMSTYSTTVKTNETPFIERSK